MICFYSTREWRKKWTKILLALALMLAHAQSLCLRLVWFCSLLFRYICCLFTCICFTMKLNKTLHTTTLSATLTEFEMKHFFNTQSVSTKPEYAHHLIDGESCEFSQLILYAVRVFHCIQCDLTIIHGGWNVALFNQQASSRTFGHTRVYIDLLFADQCFSKRPFQPYINLFMRTRLLISFSWIHIYLYYIVSNTINDNEMHMVWHFVDNVTQFLFAMIAINAAVNSREKL